jgi:hypothetical protein
LQYNSYNDGDYPSSDFVEELLRERRHMDVFGPCEEDVCLYGKNAQVPHDDAPSSCSIEWLDTLRLEYPVDFLLAAAIRIDEEAHRKHGDR